MARVFPSPATLVGGSLAGALLLAGWLGTFTRADEPRPDPAPQPRLAMAAPQPQPEPAAARTATLAETCPGQPLSQARSGRDGSFTLEAALATTQRIEPSAYVAVAREAAQQGRLRDAEVALLAACHVAERDSGSQSVPVADLKTQMAQQYAAFAASEPAGPSRESLLRRASTLLSESAITYAAALGREASKTRLAEQRLASLRDPATLQQARAELREEEPTQMMGAAPPFAPPPAMEPRTDFAARLIASDPELAQLDRDMQRLQAQARSVSRDPGGLRQRDSQALAQRDAGCRDKACLLRWYAQRRSQLLDEF